MQCVTYVHNINNTHTYEPMIHN